jgi:outer membrane protein OmpA-like peptidoglycan-associated protein
MGLLVQALGLSMAMGAAAAPASAQAPQPRISEPADSRPATTTPSGDTGIWFVPTAETLAPRKWSFSVYRVNFDFQPGFTDVSNWPITFGAGMGERLELFGAVTAVNRIDRDLRPLFGGSGVNSGDAVGVVNEYPFVRDGWTGNQFGDVWIGGKFNVMSQYRQAPAAVALRGIVKLPTASDDNGAGTGKADFALDAILSKEINERVELSGFGGFIIRGDPDLFDLSNGVRWGFGAAMPARRNLRLTAELHGETYTDKSVAFTGVQPAVIGAIPIFSEQTNAVNATIGLTWLGRSGMFAGAGLNWNLGMKGRSDFGSFEDETGDAIGFQVRFGYHPGVRVHAPRPTPIPTPPPAAAPVNRPPSVRARCEPCTVEVGRTSTVTADAADPDGDTLTYKWNAPAGRLTSPADRQSVWTAPTQEGPVPVTIVVNDPNGAAATDAVTIQVIRPAVRELTFEDVHFDFDRYSLRPEATRALDEVVKALQDNAGVRIEIEGHTCNIGTAEYNLALGDRRAASVREYLTSRGIGADRLRSVSFGEERPKHENAREETRRLNRRAALVVRVQ